MKGFSLYRRLVLALFGVFLLGVAATVTFYFFELKTETAQEQSDLQSPDPVVRAEAHEELGRFGESDYEYVLWVFIPFAALSITVIAALTRLSLRGLTRASAEAAALQPGEGGRLSVEGLPMEVQPLVEAFNGTLDRLAQAYSAQRHLTADAAHELRTPLAVLALRLQKARLGGSPDWPALEHDLAQLERIVSQLLDLARKENPEHQRAPHHSLNLARVLREAAAQVLPLAEKLAREIEVSAPEELPLRGDAGDLRDLIRNLLENALHHGAGIVRVSLAVDQGAAAVRVCDEGPGLSAELRATAFERFSKGRSSSPGSGLGLAIVRQVALAHGGSVEFLPGGGGRIELRLPLTH